MAEKEDKRHWNSGRKENQKMKAFLIYHYLTKYTDEENCASIKDIIEYLDENFEIQAESRSIYRDIQEINKALLAIEEDITLEEAEEFIYNNEERKAIRHKKRIGFYLAKRKYSPENVRLLAECVHAARFVDEKRAEELSEDVSDLLSEEQAKKILHKAIVKDRVKTTNTKVYEAVTTISKAIGKGKMDTRQIKFKYLKYTLSDIQIYSERRHGDDYTVTPHSLIIDNGNYYMLGFDEKLEEVRVYRVDRMKSVEITDKHNYLYDKFQDIDIEKYTQGHFGMFDGERAHVTLSCKMHLLDAMVDRFGRENVNYMHGHNPAFFQITVPVYVSNLFFGWIAGFGKEVRILSPSWVKNHYTDYLKTIYEWNTRH